MGHIQRTEENLGDHYIDGDSRAPDLPGEDDGISAAGQSEPSVARQIATGRLRSVLGESMRKAVTDGQAAWCRQRKFAKHPISPEEQRRLIAEYTGTVTVCPKGWASGFTPINSLMRVRNFG